MDYVKTTNYTSYHFTHNGIYTQTINNRYSNNKNSLFTSFLLLILLKISSSKVAINKSLENSKPFNFFQNGNIGNFDRVFTHTLNRIGSSNRNTMGDIYVKELKLSRSKVSRRPRLHTG